MHPNADNLIATRFDTVIYDLDGTLIDSARDMRVAVSRVLADHGLPPISDEDARIFMGEGSKVTMRRAFAKSGRTLADAELSTVTREFVRDRFRGLRETLAARIESGQQAGRVAADIDPLDAAALVIAASDGLQVQWLLDPGAVDVGRSLSILERLLPRDPGPGGPA